MKKKETFLPETIVKILKSLEDGGFEAYVVGGSVRDIFLGKEPKDWDITTNAKPEEIQKIFPENFYENRFGTVTVKTEEENASLSEIQITTYRTEENYTDKRHPDEVKFTGSLEEDLARRDFTINAIALDKTGEVIDPFEGKKDLANQIIKTVGNPIERFNEDALRLLRAVRFATQLNFKIESKTYKAINQNSNKLKNIAQERIRDEFIKTIDSERPDLGMELLKDSGLMKYIIPELLEGVGVGQNLHHIYTVWEHNIGALKYSAEQEHDTDVRIASLLHDVGKPKTKRGDGKFSTFYGHEVVGARMTKKILERLKFSKKQIDKIVKLVRWHLFYYNVDEVTEKSVRRLLVNVGSENMNDLIKLREADRIGSGIPKAKPYKLRHLEYIVDKVSSDPISVGMLKINGSDLMEKLGIEAGPKLGLILKSILAKVLDDPKLNSRKKLLDLAKEMKDESESDLRKNLDRIDTEQKKDETERKNKYYVK